VRGGWLCGFRSPRVHDGRGDHANDGEEDGAAARGSGSSSGAGASGGGTAAAAAAAAKQLQFVIRPDGALHVATAARAASAAGARVDRVMLTSGVWVAGGEQLEIITAGGARHGVMAVSETSWAKLVAGLNAALLLADEAGDARMRRTVVCDMDWSPRVEGVLF
jgi:hypothetical protein